MTDFLIIAVVALILGAAARYIYKAKKSGVKCIGCAAGEGGCCSCASGAEGCGGCNGESCH